MASITELINLTNQSLPDNAGVGATPKVTTEKHRAIPLAILAELQKRGLLITPTVGNLTGVSPQDFTFVLVENIGFYLYKQGTGLEPNGSSIVAGALGGVWILQVFPTSVTSVKEVTDAPQIALNSADGDIFNVLLTNNNGTERTILKPTNGLPGRTLSFNITHGLGAPFTITWHEHFKFPVNIPAQSSQSQGARDKYIFEYSATTDTWDCIFLGISY